MTDMLSELAAVVGIAHLLTKPEDIVRYDFDGRGSGGEALAVIRPANTDQVSATMRIASRHRTRIVPQGERSGLAGAGLAHNQLVLSTERLSRDPAIDPYNRTAEADAGIPLSRLNQAAEKHGLGFPIDLAADPSIGGMVAANTGGARFLRHGDVRRNLLALEVVLADENGTILTLGRPLWKDNSGLDLKQLFTSSAGAMGIVTRATVTLQPLAASRVTAMIALSDPAVALDILLALEAHFGSLLTAFEGISAAALYTALTHVPRLRRPFADYDFAYAVLVELSSGPLLSPDQLTTGMADLLTPMMETERRAICDIAVDGRDDLWAIRHAVPEALRATGLVIACDIALRRGDVMRFRTEATREIAALWPQLKVLDFGHIGDGGLHFNMVWPSVLGALPDGLEAAVHDHVFTKVVDQFDGSFSAEHGIGPRNIEHYTRFTPAPVRALAGKIQRLVAPAGLGRVDFGIQEKEIWDV